LALDAQGVLSKTETHVPVRMEEAHRQNENIVWLLDVLDCWCQLISPFGCTTRLRCGLASAIGGKKALALQQKRWINETGTE
jgi:hypothetical protein